MVQNQNLSFCRLLVIKVFSLFFLFYSQFSLAALADVLLVSQEIIVNKDHSYSGAEVCHNGKSLFFLDRKSCLLHQQGGDCESLYISELYSAEKIFLKTDPSKFITRFYVISKNYQKHLLYKEQSWNGDDVSYSLLSSSMASVPLCAGREIISEFDIDFETRQTSSEKEERVVQFLISNGFQVVNVPTGALRNLDFFEMESQEGLKGFSAPSLAESSIRTPLCNEKVDKELLYLLGGELTGSGIFKADLEILQKQSVQLLKDSGKSQNLPAPYCRKIDIEI